MPSSVGYATDSAPGVIASPKPMSTWRSIRACPSAPRISPAGRRIPDPRGSARRTPSRRRTPARRPPLPGAERSEDLGDALGAAVAESQQIEVPRRPEELARPEREQQGPFEHEPRGVLRAGQPVEEPLHPIPGQQPLEVLPRLAAEVEQPLSHRGRHVLRIPPRHTRDSR